MEINSFTGIFIILLLLTVLCIVGCYKLYEKAGRKGWEAIVPIYSAYIMLKICGRPAWWIIWFFIPVINIIVGIGVIIDFAKSYGKFKMSEQAAAVLLGFIYLPKWGFDKHTKYVGPAASEAFREKHKKQLKKTPGREWAEAIIFAVVAATLIRTFFIEAYVIPTPSMERSLLVGDFLFVSKINYGPRVPETPVAFPFAAHNMPLIGIKSYWDGIELPYYRFPGLTTVKRGDVVVFNYPQDTIDNRPVDKRENYIKRCQGIAGDTVSVVNGQVYIDGKAAPDPPGEQMEYSYRTTGEDVNPMILDQLHVTTYEGHQYPAMTKEAARALQGYSNVKDFTEEIAPRGISDTLNPVFPHVFPIHVMLTPKIPDYHWNVDNFGPIIIPKKGWTVKLDSMTFPLYERAIEVYENNKLEVKDGKIFINGTQTDSYTFKMNYYWMMGDNRHDSEDSRYWGFVPEDHIVGKALFVWMSWNDKGTFLNKIRWSRLFMGIH